jgi:hypothetical protein
MGRFIGAMGAPAQQRGLRNGKSRSSVRQRTAGSKRSNRDSSADLHSDASAVSTLLSREITKTSAIDLPNAKVPDSNLVLSPPASNANSDTDLGLMRGSDPCEINVFLSAYEFANSIATGDYRRRTESPLSNRHPYLHHS